MVFGASNIVDDIKTAIDRAFETIRKIDSHESREILMVQKTVLDDGSDSVYIGEAENVKERLIQHLRDYQSEKEKYYWKPGCP